MQQDTSFCKGHVKYAEILSDLDAGSLFSVLENIQLDRNGEDVRSSGEEGDGDSLSNNKTALVCCYLLFFCTN